MSAFLAAYLAAVFGLTSHAPPAPAHVPFAVTDNAGVLVTQHHLKAAQVIYLRRHCLHGAPGARQRDRGHSGIPGG